MLLFFALYGSLVISSIISEANEMELANYRYKQFKAVCFRLNFLVHFVDPTFFLYGFVFGAALNVSITVNLALNFNQSVVDSQVF